MNLDKKLAIAVGFLIVFGLVMMSSMSIASSFDITGENDFYLLRHFKYILIGIVGMAFAFRFPLDYMRRWSLPIYLVGIALILATIWTGESYGTSAKLWLKIAGFSFQPIEIAKLTIIILISSIFASGKMHAENFENGFIPFAVVLGIPALLLIIQSDFGALLVIVLTTSIIYFVAGANLKHFFGGAGFLGVFAVIVSMTVPYIRNRVQVFLNPELDPLNAGFQVKQALIAIGSGGMWGRGFQNSIQKFDYLPEVQSDTIFAAISEEMGFFRILILISIYLVIVWRGFAIAGKVHDKFYRYLAIGLSSLITVQAFVNIGVNTALLPNTGITLPFISYGGSSIIMMMFAAGLLLQISTKVNEKHYKRYF
jgi:cell division protein FtsW